MPVACPCCQRKTTLSNGWGLCFACGCQWVESKRKPSPQIAGCEGLNPAAYREVVEALKRLVGDHPGNLCAHPSDALIQAKAAIAKAKEI